jgi:hypothetical protein
MHQAPQGGGWSFPALETNESALMLGSERSTVKEPI